MGVVLKRMMVRAASRIAERFGIQAIVTGEALGQVSSQTLTNLRLIDEASESLVLRPLITTIKNRLSQWRKKLERMILLNRCPSFVV